MDGIGANFVLSEQDLADLEAMFGENGTQATPPATEPTGIEGKKEDDPNASKGQTDGGEPADTTKAFAKRLKESTDKARDEERERIAKEMGYESYEEMTKARTNKLYDDHQLNKEDVEPIVNQLVEERIQSDPRMKELSEFRKQRIAEYGKKELEEITKLTNGKVTNLNQLSREVLDDWAKGGSLKSSFMKFEGEKLILEMRGDQSKGSSSHMSNPNGNPSGANTQRHLTDDEKRAYRAFYPGKSEEELNKILVDM